MVTQALGWLKANNSRYYGNITISFENLSLLPEDDIPPEIDGLLHSDDVGIIDQEGAGYVPDGENNLEAHNENSSEGPDVIPLQVSGWIGTDLSKLSANEMMLWGLSNLWKEGKEGGYAIRHSHYLSQIFHKRRRKCSQMNLWSLEKATMSRMT
ncbi:hypothetical protein QCA50_017763 [Cerrena zonata]|uniref:Uncharacterized protein n=1 Tax=Cerrena zonata TaxID=2478898 RepID=A0AAW0FCJ0_9APHY